MRQFCSTGRAAPASTRWPPKPLKLTPNPLIVKARPVRRAP
jgi:hypothetical protein